MSKLSFFVALACSIFFVGCGSGGLSSEILEDALDRNAGVLVAVASLAGTSPEGNVPLTERFDGSSSYSKSESRPIVSYSWDFGDGSPPSTGPSSEHTYARPGTYVATLTVADEEGTTANSALEIRALPAQAPLAPLARILKDGQQFSGPAPLSVTLNGAPSVARTLGAWLSSFKWDFGDGSSPASGPAVSHVYGTPGRYLVTLTVTDSLGLTALDTVEVNVSTKPPDSGHTTEWAKHLVTPGFDEPIKGLNVDGDGNHIVAASFQGSGAQFGGPPEQDGTVSFKSLVAKYDASGKFVWQRIFRPRQDPQSPEDIPEVDLSVVFSASALTASGDIWLAGHVNGEVDFPPAVGTGPFLLKLSASGETRMVLRTGPPPIDLAVDASGNVYEVAYYNIQKRKADGTVLWSRPYPWTIYSAALDSSGNLVVAGMDKESDIDARALVAKLDPNGEPLWTKSLGSGPNRSFVSGIRMGKGDTYIAAGQFDGDFHWAQATIRPKDVSGTDNGFVLAGKSDGSEQWVRQLPLNPHRPAVDPEGNAFIALLDEQAQVDLLKAYDLQGSLLWEKHLGTLSTEGPSSPYATASALAARGGRLSVAGHFAGTVDFGKGAITADGIDAFLFRLTP